MMSYMALKPCRMMGKDYIAGDTIPNEAVLPEREAALVAMGLITAVADNAEPEAVKPAKKNASAKAKAGGGTK